MIEYISTRGGGKPQSFTNVLLAGMAPDGGLYVPASWPVLDRALLTHMQGLGYGEIAMQVLQPFVGGDISADALRYLIAQTYESDIFDHSAVAPLNQIGPNAWLMELFHGPTWSFKDYAMQLLGRLFDYVLEQRGQKMTIIGATSGDTGSAAIEACKNCRHIDIFILHPHNRVSEVQRRQMTSVGAENVHNIAIKGTFDDCQALVKEFFADSAMRQDLNLSAVNSINWARIMAQIVYYVSAATALGAPERPISFTVPTGNFGNVFAAYAARQMGLPIHRLVVATNRNDILTRFFESGTMSTETVTPSLSPSMDIQISSNFERYLYEALGHDPQKLAPLMAAFRKEGRFTVDESVLKRARQDFSAYRSDDEQTLAMMRDYYEQTGSLIDPHSAVGLCAAMQAMNKDPAVPMVVLGCAHPAKFPEAVQQATGQQPPAPPRMQALMKKAEHMAVLPDEFVRVKSYIYQRLENQG